MPHNLEGDDAASAHGVAGLVADDHVDGVAPARVPHVVQAEGEVVHPSRKDKWLLLPALGDPHGLMINSVSVFLSSVPCTLVRDPQMRHLTAEALARTGAFQQAKVPAAVRALHKLRFQLEEKEIVANDEESCNWSTLR